MASESKEVTAALTVLDDAVNRCLEGQRLHGWSLSHTRFARCKCHCEVAVRAVSQSSDCRQRNIWFEKRNGRLTAIWDTRVIWDCVTTKKQRKLSGRDLATRF